jgi:integrase
MGARKLTQLRVDSAKAGTDQNGTHKRTEIPDAVCRGLYLIVQPSGVKSWAVRYRCAGDGKPRKLTLDRTDDGTLLGLAAARVAASQVMLLVSQGLDPAADKRATRALAAEQEAKLSADTIAVLFDEFLTLQKRKLRPNTLLSYSSIGRRFIVPTWGTKLITDVKKRDVLTLTEAVATDRPTTANRLFEVVRTFFGWALARDIITINPVAGLKPPATEEARQRFLNDAEIAELWTACNGSVAGAALQFMLLTGGRRTEVAEMEWREIDEAAHTWTIPAARSKNKRQHVVPLSALAWSIVSRMPRIEGCRFVFTNSGTKPIGNFNRFTKKLDGQLSFNDWVIHDLRRSCAAGLQRLNIRTEVIELCLNHRGGSFAGVAGTYQADPLDEQRRGAMQLWSDHVAKLVKPKLVTLKKHTRG